MRGKPRVVAACAEATRRGIVRGMTLEQARALAADLVAASWDEGRFARAALDVTTALLKASPRVSWERGNAGTGNEERLRNEGVWWVDAAGLGDEKRLAQQLLKIARHAERGPAQIGIADSAIAAYAATFPIPRSSFPRSPLTRIVPSGRDAAFLAPYPLRLLDLGEDLAETFAALGLTTVGQVASLEEGEVESRFGPDGLAAWRLARGADTRGPSLPRDDALAAVECDLGDPVSTAEPLLFVMRGALDSLGTALHDKGLAAREITVTLSLDDGTKQARAVRPARPTSHPGALFDHCRALLDDWRLEEPVTAIALRATDTAPASGEQGSLLATRWADPAALEAAFERIRGKEGADAVVVPAAGDGHLPADGGAWEDGNRKHRFTIGDSRFALPRSSALRLLPRARPVRVRLGRAGLEAFRDGEVWTDVTSWSGPDRVAPRWWRAVGGSRDYFVARAATGELWLLFRTGKQWCVEGWWD